MAKAKPQCLVFDGNGGAEKIELEDVASQEGVVWVKTKLSSVKSVLKQLPAAPHLTASVLASKEPRPRSIVVDDSLLATFRGVNLNAGSDPEDMVSIRVWIKGNLIVTSQRRNLMAVSDIENDINNGMGPKDSADFLEHLLAGLTEKASNVVSDMGDQLDVIEDGLSSMQNQDGRRQVSDIRRVIIQLRRYLSPQREALTRIQPSKLSWLDDMHLVHLREVTDSCTRVLEDLDAERERATVLYEEFFALSQEVINQKMYLLTLVAIIFMPLSFITGLLGINVGGIPGAEYRFGFWSVCILLAVIFFLQCWFLYRRKWI